MDIDMEAVYGNEDYEELQRYFESRKNDYPNAYISTLNRLKNEYIPDIWEGVDMDGEKRNKISDRQKTIRRILELLQEVSPNSEEPSVSKTKS